MDINVKTHCFIKPNMEGYGSEKGAVLIKYLPKSLSPKLPADNKIFDNKQEMLEGLQSNIFEENENLPISERYRGFEDGFTQKILGILKRLGYILRYCSIKEGLRAYDISLSGRACQMLKTSTKEIRDYEVLPHPTSLLNKNGDIHTKLATTIEHLKNGRREWTDINGKKHQIVFKENGNTVIPYDITTSSAQRNRKSLAHARKTTDKTTGKTISYTGRPDTKEKTVEQVEWMFRSELMKDEKKRRGLKYNPETNSYTLTYIVNNLMSPSSLSWLGGMDEKESTLREEETLRALSENPLTIDGKTVHVKPLYFVEALNSLPIYSSLSEQKRINQRGLAELRKMKNDTSGLLESEKTLLDTAFRQLENPTYLLPEETLFYRILIAQLLDLGQVVHCKSSKDRTAIGLALSMTLQGWRNLGYQIDQTDPHKVLSDPDFKEFYKENLISGLPITRLALSEKPKIKSPGFSWGVNAFNQSPTALRMLPQELKREGARPLLIRIRLLVLPLFGSFFEQDINYLKRAFPKESFNLDHPFVKASKLFLEKH